ncbi:hypothetical protein B0H66DRAFT_640903 [Apodospora peruviana]|uniref:Uncharacterized protein n=1 Tax=Apodospora peruviana TaxID=516989 RepID=A0AAE0HZX4_9PEZI|nr:hypothetical protein B0H66DRAFT_640903 [Apodospora peruviana]
MSTSVDSNGRTSGNSVMTFRPSAAGSTMGVVGTEMEEVSTTAGSAASEQQQLASAANTYNPTTFAVMLILTITAAALTAKGWESSLMQVVCMVPVAFSLYYDATLGRQSRVWSWAFLETGSVLAVVAPSIYCVLPTEYSAVLAFVGSVIQALIILQAMVLGVGQSLQAAGSVKAE